MTIRLRRKEFERWLAQRPEDEFIPRDPEACPIACYLARNGESYVSVGVEGIDLEEETIKSPRWACRFIDAVDAIPGSIVTGREAVELLAVT